MASLASGVIPSHPSLLARASSWELASWAGLEVGHWFYSASPWLLPLLYQASSLEAGAKMVTEYPLSRPCKTHRTHMH